MNNDYLLNLISNASNALTIKPKEINIFPFFKKQDLDGLNYNQGIYIIEEIDADIQKTFDLFLEHKKKCLVAMPTANKPNNVLYVGSSVTDLKHRLLQHLGYGYRKTYALHLKDWFDGRLQITTKFYDTTPSILQLIEDNIAYSLLPAFGKRGSAK